MVAGGLGVTLLPELALRHGILDGTGLVARPIASGRPGRRVALAWRKGAARSAEFRMLAEFLRRHAGRNRSGPLDSAAPLD
jgi:LysR family hydrogen peroxide-inducible transcriptional activator